MEDVPRGEPELGGEEHADAEPEECQADDAAHEPLGKAVRGEGQEHAAERYPGTLSHPPGIAGTMILDSARSSPLPAPGATSPARCSAGAAGSRSPARRPRCGDGGVRGRPAVRGGGPAGGARAEVPQPARGGASPGQADGARGCTSATSTSSRGRPPARRGPASAGSTRRSCWPGRSPRQLGVPCRRLLYRSHGAPADRAHPGRAAARSRRSVPGRRGRACACCWSTTWSPPAPRCSRRAAALLRVLGSARSCASRPRPRRRQSPAQSRPAQRRTVATAGSRVLVHQHRAACPRLRRPPRWRPRRPGTRCARPRRPTWPGPADRSPGSACARPPRGCPRRRRTARRTAASRATVAELGDVVGQHPEAQAGGLAGRAPTAPRAR